MFAPPPTLLTAADPASGLLPMPPPPPLLLLLLLRPSSADSGLSLFIGGGEDEGDSEAGWWLGRFGVGWSSSTTTSLSELCWRLRWSEETWLLLLSPLVGRCCWWWEGGGVCCGWGEDCCCCCCCCCWLYILNRANRVISRAERGFAGPRPDGGLWRPGK